MRLKELEKYNPITIQSHDNPDSDSLASGFGLYTYFKSKGKDVRFIYTGREKIQKTNIRLMVEKLQIPIEYAGEITGRLKGLLITVDCQYGSGNITRIAAEEVAVIDHHQVENGEVELSEIRPHLGSCSTLVWDMLLEENYPVEEDVCLGTALYYGLFSDTGQLAEIHHPLDKDMRDSLVFRNKWITLFKNSNISLEELEIAGLAMIRYIYNDEYKYAIIHAKPCDPNILGLISDFLLQVENVSTCVVYNEREDGYKLSVRSCVREVMASELASFLCEKIGSGGGLAERAGGFISKKLYEKNYHTIHSESFFSQKMNEYFERSVIIDSKEYRVTIADMDCVTEKRLLLGYVRIQEVFPYGTPITIRSGEGDLSMVVASDFYIVIGSIGEITVKTREAFEKEYEIVETKYCEEICSLRKGYIPTVKNQADGTAKKMQEYARVCRNRESEKVYIRKLKQTVKVFTLKNEEEYQLGKEGDYLAVRCNNLQDIFIVEKELFHKMYELES